MSVQTKTTGNITVNISSGAKVSISATMLSRKVVIDEDPINGSAAGMNVYFPEDNFTAAVPLAAGEQITLGDDIAFANGHGPIVGLPAQTIKGETIVATVLCKLISVGAATKARVQETS